MSTINSEQRPKLAHDTTSASTTTTTTTTTIPIIITIILEQQRNNQLTKSDPSEERNSEQEKKISSPSTTDDPSYRILSYRIVEIKTLQMVNRIVQNHPITASIVLNHTSALIDDT